MLTRESILQAQDLPSETVNVPEWGGQVRVRTLTGTERDQFESALIERKGHSGGDRASNLKNIRARLVAMSCVDAEGKLLFTPQDVDLLAGKSAKALDRVFAVAQRLSGLGKDDVEDLAGN